MPDWEEERYFVLGDGSLWGSLFLNLNVSIGNPPITQVTHLGLTYECGTGWMEDEEWYGDEGRIGGDSFQWR